MVTVSQSQPSAETGPVARPGPEAERTAAFERRFSFEPGYDTLAYGGGVAAMKLRWVLIGPKGATQWLVGTQWFQKSARAHLDKFPVTRSDLARAPEGWDLGYHAAKPLFEDQSDSECDLLPGGRCFYDGSGLAAELLIEGFLTEGEPYVWRALGAYYAHLFDGAPWPFSEDGALSDDPSPPSEELGATGTDRGREGES